MISYVNFADWKLFREVVSVVFYFTAIPLTREFWFPLKTVLLFWHTLRIADVIHHPPLPEEMQTLSLKSKVKNWNEKKFFNKSGEGVEHS